VAIDNSGAASSKVVHVNIVNIDANVIYEVDVIIGNWS
jgi:hypothetical protein